MNYRHAFHAGNFADVMKHAILLQVLARLDFRAAATTVIDTHAGAGVYDLQGELALRSGEAQSGVLRLMAERDPPQGFAPLIAAVRRWNTRREVVRYPGSPMLIVQALRPADRYVGCELRADDQAILADQLSRLGSPRQGGPRVQATAIQRDGYAEAGAFLQSGRAGLLFVDPPFETGREYELILDLIRQLAGRRDVCAAVWTPLKDLETFDALLRGLEASGVTDAVIAEVRLRPLSDPMRMIGCALALIGAPDVWADAEAVCAWVAAAAGEAGGSGGVFRL